MVWVSTNIHTNDNYRATMAAVEQFKNAVIRIRDILRGPGVSITGMDSMRHICLYLLSRYITRERALTMGIPAEFCWEEMIDLLRNQSGGLQFVFEKFCNPHIDCLVNHLDRLFNTQVFTFDVKNPHKHAEILELLDGLEMDKVEGQMDILGWVYEQHLKTGSGAARDLGQFFTDRFICDYMTELCKPKVKYAGVPESVCDPSMGTGGFLTSFIKYYKKYHATEKIDWTVHQQQIHGCDTDPRVAGVARLNMFMELGGIRAENLLTHDSLYGDLPETGYDVILANMPFGIKGIKHTDCCERVKDLKIRGTKSEPLFLQLMMASLNMGGRCAVVVPDGVLTNTAVLHRETRKYLLEHFELKRVIKMQGQFFMNTGIQPSILFFENTGNPTENVEFWEVIRDEYGNVTESMQMRISSTAIDEYYTMDVRKYSPCVDLNGVTTDYPLFRLDEVAVHQNGKTLTKEEKDKGGDYDVMGGGMTYVGKTNRFNREGETISVSKSGASAGFVAYHNKRYWAGDCLTIIPKDKSLCLIKYLYYYLKTNNNVIMSKTTGTTIPHCKWDDICNIRIVLPPLSIQKEIVSALDTILEMDNSVLSQSITNKKTQMAAFIKSIQYRSVQWFNLKDIVDYQNGKTLTKKQKEEGGNYDVMGGGMTYVGKTNQFNREGETISISKSGASAGFVAYHNKQYWAGDCLTMVPKENAGCLIKYLYYYLKMNNNVIMSKTTGTTIPHCKWDDIRNLQIPLPTTDFQAFIVSNMDTLQEQIEYLEAMQKQSEGDTQLLFASYLGI